jgi:hypothetical protein
MVCAKAERTLTDSPRMCWYSVTRAPVAAEDD